MTDENKIKIYKDLLVRRDTLLKERENIWWHYLKTFGTVLQKLFNIKIECITLKKKIAYYTRKLNRNEIIDISELENSVRSELKDYYEMLDDIDKVKDADLISVSSFDMMRIKKLYRKIVSMIHPDLHPELFRRDDIRELWAKAKDAYDASDIDALEDTEFLIQQTLKIENPDTEIRSVKNIDNRIKNLKEEINNIVSTHPYNLKFILTDPSLIAEKQQELEEEIQSYHIYYTELQDRFNELQNNSDQRGAKELLN